LRRDVGCILPSRLQHMHSLGERCYQILASVCNCSAQLFNSVLPSRHPWPAVQCSYTTLVSTCTEAGHLWHPMLYPVCYTQHCAPHQMLHSSLVPLLLQVELGNTCQPRSGCLEPQSSEASRLVEDGAQHRGFLGACYAPNRRAQCTGAGMTRAIQFRDLEYS
jgi:hypothetical protein